MLERYDIGDGFVGNVVQDNLTLRQEELPERINSPLEFIKMVRSFGGGAGLSQQNVTQLLTLLKKP